MIREIRAIRVIRVHLREARSDPSLVKRGRFQLQEALSRVSVGALGLAGLLGLLGLIRVIRIYSGY